MILKYKVYERLELQGIEPFNTLIGSFRYNEDANKFLKRKNKKRLTTTTQFVSLFSFSRKGNKGLFAPYFFAHQYLIATPF